MTCVFLMGFGQPQSLDELKDFIERVTGRTPSDEAVKAARQRYELIGGKSPLTDITRKQAGKLHELLEQEGVSASVYMAMRHSQPGISDAIRQAKKDSGGDKRAVVITLAPQYSDISVGAYIKLFDEANEAEGKTFTANSVRSYGTHRLFLEAVAGKLKEALEKPNPLDTKTTPVIFSAHSLPAKSQEAVQPYIDELQRGMQAVAEMLGLGKYRLAYQSKGGGRMEWLGPSIEDVMAHLKSEGESKVVVSPLGFVSDHIETLYDIDILAKSKADELGLEFRRSASLNDSPAFIKLLATLVKENMA